MYSPGPAALCKLRPESLAGTLWGALTASAFGPENQTLRVGSTPAFYIDVYSALIQSHKMVLPQYAFIANEISHDEVRKPEVLDEQRLPDHLE